MSVRIQLDKSLSHYTTFDTISGRVIVNLKSSTTVEEIVVKLEAESKTRLDNEKGQYNAAQPDRKLPQTVELEFHKVLYEVASVFPGSLGQDGKKSGSYTLRSGQHEYTFSFKIPFLNSCFAVNSFKNNLNVRENRIEMAKNTDRHVRNPLPPSLPSYPQMAEIKYFVKVTVKRPMFFKENLRAEQPFNFIPIEPPRPPPSDRQVFVRRKHIIPVIHQPLQKKKSFFGKMKPPKAPAQNEEVRISVEARLPQPGIITCNQPLPLRISATKMSAHAQQVMLRNLQIRLIGTTQMRAHELQGLQRQFWVIVSHTDLHIPIGSPNDPVDTEWEIPSNLWASHALPHSVIPSFETCNIAVTYQMEAIVGLSASPVPNFPTTPQNIPVSMPVEVYSGIEAPPELLRRLKEGITANPMDEKQQLGTTDGSMMNHFNGNSSSYVGPSPAYGQTGQGGKSDTGPPAPPAGADGDLDLAPPPSYDAVITESVHNGAAGPSNGFHQPPSFATPSSPAGGGPSWPGAWPNDQKR